MKTFIVPVIHVVSFGLDVEVQAENAEEAKKKALADRGEPSDGYDWDRMNFERAELGDWQEVEQIGEDMPVFENNQE